MLAQLHKRIIDWNAARYEREYNHDLTISLLDEEVSEGVHPDNEAVDELDSFVDVYFVATGALWKRGNSEAEIVRLLKQAINAPEVSYSMAKFWLTNGHPDKGLALYMAASMLYAHTQLKLNGEQFARALKAVCDSNDTKPAAKTASDIKANVDKGASFVPPTAALQAILDEVRNA